MGKLVKPWSDAKGMVGDLPVPWCYPLASFGFWSVAFKKPATPSLGTLRTTLVAAMAALKWTRTSKTFRINSSSPELMNITANWWWNTDHRSFFYDETCPGPWVMHPWSSSASHKRSGPCSVSIPEGPLCQCRIGQNGHPTMGFSNTGWPCPKSWKAVLSCSLVLVKCFICFGGISKSLG